LELAVVLAQEKVEVWALVWVSTWVYASVEEKVEVWALVWVSQ
jgi:hypothetical protein